MGERIYFNGGPAADTGEATSDAIRPITDGENVVGDVPNRPMDNLRFRTEQLRVEANYNKWVQDADRGVHFHLVAGTLEWEGTVTGGGTGALVLTTGPLRVIPMYGTGKTRTKTTTFGTSLEGSGTLYPAQLAYAELSDSVYLDDGFDIVASATDERFAFDGSNEITITIQDTGVATIDVTVNGDGTVTDPGAQPGQDDIVVSIDATTHTRAQVEAAINGDPVAGALVDCTYIGTVADSTVAYAVSKTFLTDALDGVYHEITAATFTTFFAGDNLLEEGDVFGIYYDTVRQRRRSIEETTEHTIPVSSLVNMTAEPAKAPGCVVIGRVINDVFVLANGVPLDKDAAASSLNPVDTLIRDDYERANAGYTPPAHGVSEGTKRLGVDASTFTYLSTASKTQQNVNEDIDVQIDELRDDIERGITTPPTHGTQQGSKRLGVDASTFEYLSTSLETQQAVNEALDQGLKTPILTVGPTLGFHATLQAALTAAGALSDPTVIEILEPLSIDGSTVNALSVPDGCHVRGRGCPQNITVSDLGATHLFDLDAGTGIVFENLTFIGSGAMNAASAVFGETTTPVTDLVIRRCALLQGGTAATTWGHFINFDNMPTSHLHVVDCPRLEAKTSVILLDTGGAATDVDVLIQNCQFGDTSTWANGSPLDIDQSTTDNTRVTVRDCYFGTIDSGTVLGQVIVGARVVALENLNFKNCQLKTASSTSDDVTVHANGLRFDFSSMPSDYAQDADSDSYAMTLVTSDYSKIHNVEIDMTDATYAGITVYGILVNTSDYVTLSNIRVDHAPGVGIGVKNTSQFTVISNSQFDGGVSSYGIEVGEDASTTVARTVITSCIFDNYSVQTAVWAYGDNLVLGDLLVDQGSGGNGYTLDASVSGTGISNVYVF